MSGYVYLYKVKNNEKEYLTDEMGRKIVFDLCTADEVTRDMLKWGVVVSFENVSQYEIEAFLDSLAYCEDMIEEVTK